VVPTAHHPAPGPRRTGNGHKGKRDLGVFRSVEICSYFVFFFDQFVCWVFGSYYFFEE
jgi:hypothetical protein